MTVLREQLRRELQVAGAAQRQAQSGATHEEAKPENDKDTRAVEASYLARGQAQRVVQLEGELARLEGLGVADFPGERPIGLGAAIELEGASGACWYLLSPAGAGQVLEVDGTAVRVVSPRSPVGRALVGRGLGDDVNVETPQGVREYSVIDVR